MRAFVSCPSGNLVAFPQKTEKVRIENICPSQLSNYMFISTLVGSTGEGLEEELGVLPLDHSGENAKY